MEEKKKKQLTPKRPCVFPGVVALVDISFFKRGGGLNNELNSKSCYLISCGEAQRIRNGEREEEKSVRWSERETGESEGWERERGVRVYFLPFTSVRVIKKSHEVFLFFWVWGKEHNVS